MVFTHIVASPIERQPLLKSQFQIENLYTAATCLLSEGGNKQVPL